MGEGSHGWGKKYVDLDMRIHLMQRDWFQVGYGKLEGLPTRLALLAK